MTHLLRLEPKWIVVLDDTDEERMIDREHYEQWLVDTQDENMETYWYWARELNDSQLRRDFNTYLTQHHTLNTIEGLKIELT